jgi:aspartate/methionine/tyrosine aminotransferase
MEFAGRLAEKEKMNVTPGKVFGGNKDDFVRVALVRPVPVLEEAVERLRGFVEPL